MHLGRHLWLLGNVHHYHWYRHHEDKIVCVVKAARERDGGLV